MTKHAWAQGASAGSGRQLPMLDDVQLGLSEAWSCPEHGHDYVKAAAWLFALLFGPALVALIVLLAS
jgi:hypothetical protein